MSPSSSNLHALLLLSDSALPLSSFAFSSGLESYLAHHSGRGLSASARPSKLSLFLSFLNQSLSSLARTALPFMLAAYDYPAKLVEWDDTCDASTLCNVGRRQSVEQGRALLAVWMRGLCRLDGGRDGLRAGRSDREPETNEDQAYAQGMTPVQREVEARSALLHMDAALRQPPSRGCTEAQTHGHLAPLFGAVAGATGVGREDAAYVFLLNHVKSLVSAAVRAGVCGPFKQQEILASRDIREAIEREVRQAQRIYAAQGVESAGQTVGLLDLWLGRHEILYSRVFNS